LIAGFGNVLLGDDGFGVAVVERLAARELPAHVEVTDVGIGGLHFVLRLLEGVAEVIVVDAMRRGEPPGTLYLGRPNAFDPGGWSGEAIDPHAAEPARALKLAGALGCLPGRVWVVGCEPASCRPRLGLTPAVQRAVERAVAAILGMVGQGAPA
jgi:hydrogenase maturation protease